MPVNFRQKESLITTTRNLASLVVDKGQRRIDLRGCQSSGQQRGAVDCVEISRSTKHCDSGEIASLLVVTKEKEQLLFYDWPTNSSTELVARIFRLERDSRRNSVN